MSYPVASQLIKVYPPRGPLQQYRFKEATAFHCFRCGASKKSKLITIYNNDWHKRLCNGCYGKLLSIYNVKAGTGPSNEKAEALAEILLSLLTRDQEREAQRLFQTSEKRSIFLSEKTTRFLATADYVARSLSHEASLDWSPAVIGLCKAVELELVERLIIPLNIMRGDPSLDKDVKDKDIGRIAKFIRDGTGKPPELGTFAHFLQTLINSKSRRTTSALMQAFLGQLRDWPGANWILDLNGLYESLLLLTRKFRNRAAHVDDLEQQDFENCRALVIGDQGLIWRLVQATQLHR